MTAAARFLAGFAVCCLTAACRKPISDLNELDGCYFVGSGSTPAFEIHQSELRSPQARSTLSLGGIKHDVAVLRFSPGVAVTDDVHKSTVIISGDEVAAFAFRSGNRRYILFNPGEFPAQFERRDCSQ